jgi:hypothetical protein
LQPDNYIEKDIVAIGSVVPISPNNNLNIAAQALLAGEGNNLSSFELAIVSKN